MDNAKYVEYVNSYTDEISEYVNECFEQSKEFIKAKLIRIIRDKITPIPVHYEWENGYEDNPYDHSGTLVENGYISLDLTVRNFLENEYSGNRKATFVSGHGWDYFTYEDEISNDTLDIASDIMLSAIRRHIENHFGENLSDDDLSNIRDSCGEFDEIYDNCKACDFFWAVGAAEFIGIENLQLKDIVKKGSVSYGTTKK